MEFRQAFDPKRELALIISAKDHLPNWALLLGFNQGVKLLVNQPEDLQFNHNRLKDKKCVLFMPQSPTSPAQRYAKFKCQHHIRDLYFYLTKTQNLMHVLSDRLTQLGETKAPARIDQLCEVISSPLEHFSRRRFDRSFSTARAKILVSGHEFYGQFVDFSGQGARLIMPGVLKEKTFIAIQYLGDGGRPVTMHCSVQWSQSAAPPDNTLPVSQSEFFMGIRFIGAA